MLADDLREPGRPRDALPGARRVGWPVEVPEGRPKVWSCERHADELPWARRIFTRSQR